MRTEHEMRLGVVAGDPERAAVAKSLAERVATPLVDCVEGLDFALVVEVDRVELRAADPNLGGALYVDFLSGTQAFRREHGGVRNQGLAKAIGLKKGAAPPTVFDATAGLGRDAFLMAWWGCQVRACERSPWIHALLEDGLTRALQDPGIAERLQDRLVLECGEAVSKMCAIALEDRPDVVYLDPMHPPRSKSALTKKEMRFLRPLVGDDGDSVTVFQRALEVAKQRVVIKRPASADALHQEPDFVVRGRSTRFDVCLT